MIPVRKPASPAILATGTGREATRALVEKFDGGQRDFEFAAYFRHPTVKSALKAAQHNKCAFCESKIPHISHGDVEHFRPKDGSQQNRGDALSKPEYFWLAYEWDNLFFVCQICNQPPHKGNLFPLVDPSARARSPHDDLARESPLLISPDEDGIHTLLTFVDDLAVPVANNPRARATIQAVGLNRAELQERRRDRLETLRLLRASLAAFAELAGHDAHRAELAAAIAAARRPDAEYSAMNSAFLHDANIA